jgi:FkbM family methyltransferase
MQGLFLRFLNYFSYLRKTFGFWGAFLFMYFYTLAKLRGDKQSKLHYIPVGPYSFYFPTVENFAGLFNEIFFKEEYYLDKTTEPIVALDCGANIGVSLLYIKLRAPNARVTCFEPNLAAQKILQKNIEANGWQSSVTVITAALGKQKGSAQFYLDAGIDTDSSGSLTARSGNEKVITYTVQVEQLSNYLNGAINFLKIDIEGSEFDVLEEVITSGKLQNVSLIELEYHDSGAPTAKTLSDLLKLLESQGFQTAIQSAIHPHEMVKGWRKNCLVYAWR